MRLTMAVLLVGCVCGGARSQGLLKNGDFEEFDAQGLPVGWQQYAGGVPESRLEPSTDAHSGQHGLKLIDIGPNAREARWSIGVQQDAEVKPGDKLVASVWVKALARNNDQAVIFQLNFLPMDQAHVVFLAPQMDGAWHQVRNYAEAPPGADKVRVYLYTMHFWTSQTLLDGASLKKATAEEFGEMMPLAAWGTGGPEKAHEVQRRWPVVNDGKTVTAIVAPDEPAYREAAAKLAETVGQWGNRRPEVVLVPAPGPELRGWKEFRPGALGAKAPVVIALGNVNNNPLCAHMVFNRCAFEDSLFPGAGAFALRTVAAPYELPPGSSLILVGCSDGEGAKAGVQELARRLAEAPDHALPWTVFVSNAKRLSDPAKAELLARDLKGEFVEFNSSAETYLRTGDPAYAEATRRALLACWARYLKDPQRSITWPEETTSDRIGSLWAVVEACPVFTDADRLTAARTLLTCLYSLPRHCSCWGTLAKNDTIIWNHTTFPLLGIYWLTRYFQKAYPDLDADRMTPTMAEVEGAFRGQLKCWKPQCDADSYLTIVPQHTIEYTLSRNDYTWFENGNVRTYAEYLSTLSDPRGVLPGLGDSGYATSPGYELEGLPIAFWYYQDPRFLWRLNKISQGHWANPYHTNVEPREWQEWAGVTVFPLHEEVYKYTINQGYYDEGPAPPNVPLEQAFDKIAFRENLQEDGQYLLLDGYGRGKHLHWDVNSIIKLCQGGQDWLIDADYLVRNTTEHNMVSVLRDGRCDAYPPACAGLMAQGVFDQATMTQTALLDYNGTDWKRNLFWDRGKWFVVLDEVAPKQPGEYTVDVVWKTPRQGKQELVDGRAFTSSRWTGPRVGSYGLATVANPAPGVASAVRFTDQESQLDFPLELPAGDYVVTTWAYGLDTGTDSFWVQVDGGQRVAFHIPIGEFGASSTAATKDTPTPNIKIEKAGRHRITVSLRENPGVMLGRITFQDPAGKLVAEVRADAPPAFNPGEIDLGPSRVFHVVGDGVMTARFVDRDSNVGLKIRKLWQRKFGKLAAGEAVATANLLYMDMSDAARTLDVRRVGPAALVTGPEGPVALAGARPIPNAPEALRTDAKLYLISPTTVRLVGCTSWGSWLKAAKPVSIEIDLEKAEARAAQGAAVAAEVGGKSLSIAAGGTASLADWAGLKSAAAAVRKALAEVAKSAPAPATAKGAGPGAEPPKARVVWQTAATEGEARVIRVADLNGDGKNECVLAVGKEVACLDGEGRRLWGFAAQGKVNDVWVADLDTPARKLYAEGPEVLVGSDDESLYVLSAKGDLLKTLRIDYPLRVGTSSISRPRVSNVIVGDLDGSGPSIIVGTLNGCLARLNAALERQWLFDQIEHGSREIKLVDIDGDGKNEILTANKYGSVEVNSSAGAAMRGTYSELGDVEFAVGDLDGDGKPEIVNGSSTGALRCDQALGEEKWRFNNYGYGAFDVEIARVAGAQSVFVASETGYVYRIDAKGIATARVFLGAAVRRLAFLPTGSEEKTAVVAGTDAGGVWFLSPDLKVVSKSVIGERVTAMAAAGEGALVGTDDGRMALLTPS